MGESRTPKRDWFIVSALWVYRARKQLERELGDDRVWLPECEITSYYRRGGKFTWKGPLFPGYLFAELGADDEWQSLEEPGTIGVLTVQAKGRRVPKPIDRGFVEAVKARIRGHGGVLRIRAKDLGRSDRHPLLPTAEQEAEMLAEESAALFPPGTRLRVLDGPFASFAGIYQSDHKGRIKLLLDIFGRTTPIDIEEELLEVVEPA